LLDSLLKENVKPKMNSDAGSLKRSIEGWREIVVLMDSVLSWEKEWYPAVTSGTLSVLFLLIWTQDPNMLTLLSMVGLVATLLDYAVPRIQAKLFPETSWSPEKERKLETICQDLVFMRTGLGRVCERVSGFKESAPLMYLSGVVVTLYLVSYLGALFSGFFLTYILLITVCMLPGLHRRGLLAKYCGGIILKIGEFVKAKKLE
jgi:hypothetical protein